MTAADLLVLVPWLLFAAGLAIIGWRLLASRRARRAVVTADDQCMRGPLSMWGLRTWLTIRSRKKLDVSRAECFCRGRRAG